MQHGVYMTTPSYLFRNGVHGWLIATYDSTTYASYLNTEDISAYPPSRVLFRNASTAGAHGLTFNPAATSLGVTVVNDTDSPAVDVIIGGAEATLYELVTVGCYDTVLFPATGTGVSGKLKLHPSTLTYSAYDATFTASYTYGYTVSVVSKSIPSTGRPSAWFGFKAAQTSPALTQIPLFVTF